MPHLQRGPPRKRHYCQREETLGLLARTRKDFSREEEDVSKASQHLHRAHEFYRQGYEMSGGYWSGINAATIAFLLRVRDHAAALARPVRDHCRERLRGLAGARERYWLVSTLGEAALRLGDWPEAENWYCQAVELGRVQSTRHNVRLLIQCVAPGEGGGRIEQPFRFPSAVVFATWSIGTTEPFRDSRPARTDGQGRYPAMPKQIESRLWLCIRSLRL
jgi:hypothetical protein